MTDAEWKDRFGLMLAKYDPLYNVELFEELVTERSPVRSWTEFQTWFSPFRDGGCFRGQRDATWNLDTTLERKVKQTWRIETEGTTSETMERLNPDSNESGLLREFQRAAHHYYGDTPDVDQIVDWLALMQHHGAPTRMLDWTRSPYVALYFAMQEGKAEGDATMWALDLVWLKQRSHELLRQHDSDCPPDCNTSAFDDYINRILLKPDNPYVIVPASPKRANARMLIQQGELLCNLRHSPVFSAVLIRMLLHPTHVERQVVSRVLVERDQRIEFLEELRQMNIHEASLFPGLDGFARSLGTTLDIWVQHQIEARKKALIEFIKDRRTTANT